MNLESDLFYKIQIHYNDDKTNNDKSYPEHSRNGIVTGASWSLFFMVSESSFHYGEACEFNLGR